jgi:protein-tyrosine phosphatase
MDFFVILLQKKNRGGNQMKKFFKIEALVCSALFLCLFASCSATTIDLNGTPNGGNVSVHTQLQESYLADKASNISEYADGKAELSRPESVELTWDGKEDSAYIVQLATDENFTQNTREYETTGSKLDVYNLFVSTEYYWRVAPKETDIKKSTTYTFTVNSSAPRNIYMEGASNVRDLGGWTTQSGATVKQGLIYRGGRLNESSAETFNLELSESGQNVFLHELGVKTEIDLRLNSDNETGGMTNDVFSDVTYLNIPFIWKDGDMFTDNIEQIVEVFSVLAKPESYPVYFHCNIGTDRTGMLAYLIDGLLGVGKTDLNRDYLFSNFGNIGGGRTIYGLTGSTYYKTIAESAGDTYAEQVENCLLSVGVKQSDIDSIRNILL